MVQANILPAAQFDISGIYNGECSMLVSRTPITLRLRSTTLRAAFNAALIAVACCFGITTSQGQAQGTGSYPMRSVVIVVPFTPGTGMDILARTVGQKLGERWKQSVVVENRPGASGNIGTEFVVRAPAAGSTLLMSVNTLVMNASLYRNLPYNPSKDLAPVEEMAVGTLVATVNPSVPATTLKQFVDYAREHPGKVAYGSPGVGTPQHLATELFKSTVGVDMLHVPYKGVCRRDYRTDRWRDLVHVQRTPCRPAADQSGYAEGARRGRPQAFAGRAGHSDGR